MADDERSNLIPFSQHYLIELARKANTRELKAIAWRMASDRLLDHIDAVLTELRERKP